MQSLTRSEGVPASKATGKPVIVIDTREQKGWSFSPGFETVRRTLRTGDYSLAGLEDVVAIERKSVGDLVGTVIHDWLRFRKELVRLSGFELACLVIEGSVRDIVEKRYESDANPESILGRVNSIIIDHGVQVLWAGDRGCAVHMAERLLDLAWRRYGSSR